MITTLTNFTGLGEPMIEKILGTVLLLFLYVVLRYVLGLWINQRIKNATRRYLVRKSMVYTLGFVSLVIGIWIWVGGMKGWIAYISIVSAGLAIALQDPVTNLAGWIFIQIRRPFKVGDRIQIGESAGDVIDVRLFQFTLIEIGNWVDADQSTGRMIHIPNGYVFTKPQANYTEGFEFIWHEMAVLVTFESDWEKAKELLEEIAAKHSAIQGEEAAREIRKASRKYLIFFQHLTPIVWTSVADSGVTLTIRFLCHARKRRSTSSAVWEDILRTFAQYKNIDFAYPTTRFYDNALEGKPGARASASSAKKKK